MEGVGAGFRRADPPVSRTLAEEGHRFEFPQAVRLLEMLRERPGEVESAAAAALDEVVRFRSSISLAFPTTPVERIEVPEDGGPVRMSVAFMGLAGALGPLPLPFSELVLERAARGDFALRDFLDVFHHRLVSLLYRARKENRLALHTGPPERAVMAGQLFALAGLGTEGVRGRMRVRDRALLSYAGLLSQHPRSMAGLEGILSDHFGVPVRGTQMVGRWLSLGEREVTRIGRSGRNRKLGRGAVLGTRVWDPQGAFELRLGPLSREEFLRFLPGGGSAWAPLCDLTRFYAGTELDFTVRPVLKAAEVPAAKLSAKRGPAGGARLGWTSWLRTHEALTDAAQVRLKPPTPVPSATGASVR